MIDRRLLSNFDFGLFLIMFILFFISLFEIYSAVNAGSNHLSSGFVTRQGIWFAIGLGIFFIIISIDFHYFEQWAALIYWGVNILLIYVLLSGKYAGGSQRWISLGILNIQPSEFAKISVVIMLARYFSRNMYESGLSFRELIVPFIYTFIPFLLIAKEPDLGTAGVLILIFVFMIIFVKIEKRTFYYLTVIALIFLPVLSFFLKDYQKKRILTFLNPGRDPLGAGYHIIQSKIAIGSGMIYGKGFLKGTQNALSFIPEQHTDFIFSVYAEEWGFIGSLILLSVYFCLLVWMLKIAGSCRNVFGVLISVGATGILFWQFLINIAMVTGLFPVVGMPLPLISYGGSSVITIIVAMAILMNVSMRRYMKG